MDTLSVIVEALEQKLNHDIRDNMTKPLFQTGKTSINSLKVGDNLTGVVSSSFIQILVSYIIGVSWGLIIMNGGLVFLWFTDYLSTFI